MIEFNWDIHYKCNYRCPYCSFYGQWQELSEFNKYFSVEQWIAAWQGIYEKYGSAYIIMAGGEPIIYPSLFNLIKELSKKHKLDIITNLSCAKTQLVNFVNQLRSHNLYFSASFHPLFTDFEAFLEKVLIIKEKGILSGINYVAYPAGLKRISYFKDKFNEKGLDIVILPYRGEYNNIVYPQGYSEEEKSVIYNLSRDLSLEQQEQLDQFMYPSKPKGKLCYAGQKYAFINCDGQVYRCTQSRKALGSFFERGLLLLNDASPCEQEVCPCEFRWLAKDS